MNANFKVAKVSITSESLRCLFRIDSSFVYENLNSSNLFIDLNKLKECEDKQEISSSVEVEAIATILNNENALKGWQELDGLFLISE